MFGCNVFLYAKLCVHHVMYFYVYSSEHHTRTHSDSDQSMYVTKLQVIQMHLDKWFCHRVGVIGSVTLCYIYI